MEVHFEIENNCILKCRHCSSLSIRNEKLMDYADGDMITFLNSLPDRKYVFLTGGEPLLYNGIERLMSSLRENVRDISLGMFTTGIFGKDGEAYSISSDFANSLSKSGLETAYLSIYSNDKTKHDWMTGYGGSFELTESSIRQLVRSGIDCRINLVVTSQNMNEIDDIVLMCTDWGVSEIRLLKLVCHGNAIANWSQIGITEENYRIIVANILKKKPQIRITASGCVDLADCRPVPNKSGCRAGRELLYVTYNGDIYPCASVKNNQQYLMGNIKSVDKKLKWISGDCVLCC